MEETRNKNNNSIDNIKENKDIHETCIKKSEKDFHTRFENDMNLDKTNIHQNIKDYSDLEKKIFSLKRNGIYLFFFSSLQLFFYYGYKGRFGTNISEILKKIKNFCSKLIYSEILFFDYKHLKKIFFVSLGIGISTFILGSKFQKLFQQFNNYSNESRESKNAHTFQKQFEINLSNSYNKNNVILTEDQLFQRSQVQTTVFDYEAYIKDNKNSKIKNKRKNYSFTYNIKKIRDLKSKLYRKHFYNKKNELSINNNFTEHIKSNSKNYFYDNDSNKEYNYNNSNYNMKNFSRSITQFTNTNFSKKEFQSDDSDYSNFSNRKRDTDYSNIYHKQRNSNIIKIENDNKRFQQKILSFKSLRLNKSLNPDVSVFEKSNFYSNRSPVKKQIKAYDECNSQSDIFKFPDQNSFNLMRKLSEKDKEIKEINSNEEFKIQNNDHDFSNKTYKIKNKNLFDDKILCNEKEYYNSNKLISPSIEIENLALNKKEQEIQNEIISSVFNKEIEIKKNLSKKKVKNLKSKMLLDIKKNDRNSKIILMQCTKPKF